MADIPPPSGPLRNEQPAPPRGPLLTDHAAHDRLLVAAYAAGDVDQAGRARAAELVARCGECAALESDLRSIAHATGALPAPARPRDFRLSPADAVRLRPSGWRRLLAALAAPRSVASPLAATLTTLGVAGLLVASLPALAPAGGMLQTVGSPVDGAGAEATAAPAPAQEFRATKAPDVAGEVHDEDPDRFAPDGGNPRATGGRTGLTGVGVGTPPPDEPAVDRGVFGDDALASQADGPSPLVVGSVVLLVAGIGLYVLRRVAIRSGAR